MFGVIVGYIVSSIHEWQNIETKEFPLLCDDCFFTDNSVMAIAVAEAIMNGDETNHYILVRDIGLQQPAG